MNENFAALVGALEQALDRVDELEARNDELETRLAALEQSNVLAVNEYVEVMDDPHIADGTTVRFSGVNLQVVSGAGSTDGAVTGLGNLIVGYNETRASGTEVCDLGEYRNETECVANGGVWAVSHKIGTHNLVVGANHNYSSHGGAVMGIGNTINRQNATVTGGENNIASGEDSSVNGGNNNTASGDESSVGGGARNVASGNDSSVNGGFDNTASGSRSSVSGGQTNTASGAFSNVTGGGLNTAEGASSSIGGGRNNSTTSVSTYSSVIGGNGNSASSTDEIAP